MKYPAWLLDKRSATLFALVLFGLLTAYDIKPVPLDGEPGMYDYGSEYAQIAASLASGNGYGNVFSPDSGPSAWQPPAVTLLFALIFYLFGIKSLASLWIIVMIRLACLVGTVHVLQSMVSMTRFAQLRPLIVLIFTGLVIFNHKLVIGRVDDVAITVFLGVFTIHQVIALFNGMLPNKAGLYLLAFLLPITQPSFSMIFAFGVASYFVFGVGKTLYLNGKFSFDQLKKAESVLITSVAAGTLFVMSLGSWAIYNYSVFGKPVVFKSNMWFEFYLANVLDDDGILSRQTFSSYHPFKQAPLLADYQRLGEMAFLDTAKARSEAFMEVSPEIYREKVFNRIKNAFFYTKTVFDIAKIDQDKLSQDQIKLLDESRLIAHQNWLCLTWPKEQFVAKLTELGMPDQETVLADWEKKKVQMKRRSNQWDERIRGVLLSFIPFVCLLMGLIYTPIRMSLTFWGILVTYLLHLTPYMLISHFERYQLSVLSLQAMAIFFPLAAIAEKWLPIRLASNKKTLEDHSLVGAKTLQ